MGAWWVCVCGGAGERLGAGGEAGRSGAPARARTPARGHPASRSASSRAPRTRGLEGLSPPSSPLPGRSRLSRWAAGRAEGQRGWPGTSGDARARPGGPGVVRSSGDRARVPRARPGQGREGTAHTSSGTAYLLPRARRSRRREPSSTPTCFPPRLPLLRSRGGSPAPRAPRPGRRGKPGAPRRDALGRLRGIPRALLLQAAQLSPARPYTPLTLACRSTRARRDGS